MSEVTTIAPEESKKTVEVLAEAKAAAVFFQNSSEAIEAKVPVPSGRAVLVAIDRRDGFPVNLLKSPSGDTPVTSIRSLGFAFAANTPDSFGPVRHSDIGTEAMAAAFARASGYESVDQGLVSSGFYITDSSVHTPKLRSGSTGKSTVDMAKPNRFTERLELGANAFLFNPAKPAGIYASLWESEERESPTIEGVVSSCLVPDARAKSTGFPCGDTQGEMISHAYRNSDSFWFADKFGLVRNTCDAFEFGARVYFWDKLSVMALPEDKARSIMDSADETTIPMSNLLHCIGGDLRTGLRMGFPKMNNAIREAAAAALLMEVNGTDADERIAAMSRHGKILEDEIGFIVSRQTDMFLSDAMQANRIPNSAAKEMAAVLGGKITPQSILAYRGKRNTPIQKAAHMASCWARDAVAALSAVHRSACALFMASTQAPRSVDGWIIADPERGQLEQVKVPATAAWASGVPPIQVANVKWDPAATSMPESISGINEICGM